MSLFSIKKLFALDAKGLSSDKEFLPSALEVLESPPSPIKVALIYTVCSLFVVALIWSFIGKLDIVATAQGKIHPQGSVKVVDSLATGKVAQILVQNGDHVKAGQVLVMLDSAELQANYRDVILSLASLKAELLRRKLENDLALKASLKGEPIKLDIAIDWPENNDITDQLKYRENTVLLSELGRFNADIEDIKAQIAQNDVREQNAIISINSQEGLLQVVNQRLSMRKALMAQGALTRDEWLQIMMSVKEEQAKLLSFKANLADLKANNVILQGSFVKAKEKFLENNMQQMLQAERSINTLEAKYAEAKAKLANNIFTSPIDGVVADSGITTIGQVISVSEKVMSIVPNNSTLEVIAYVPNQEIGFIKEGQHVDLKIDAFPFTRYGTLSGTVKRVSKDAIPAANAEQAMLGAKRDNAKALSGETQSTQNLVFPLTVVFDNPNYETVNGKSLSLVSGMGVTAEIKTDRRRLIDYLISPIYDLTKNAMHER